MFLSAAFKALPPIFLALPSLASTLPTEECPLLGPLYPSTLFDLTATDAFASAVETFPETIEQLFELQLLDRETSSFALDIWSLHNNESVYSYYHAAEGEDNGVTRGEIDDETIFRIGSVSKLFTVYAVLVAGEKGSDVFNEPVTEYLPELLPKEDDERGPLERVQWEEVTIGALASYRSGAGGPGECDIPAVLSCRR